jgi:2,3-bisphosphoglycerate-dependent phosphoglycerate mutase
MTFELTMVRHGEPVRDGDGHDPRDPALSDLGIAQAGATADYLATGADVDIVFASPLKRARQTADVIAARLGAKVHPVPGLVEFDYGAEYLHYEDGAAVYAQYRAGDLSPWGTTLSEFRERILGALEQIEAQSPHGRALAVCHGGVVNAFTTHVLGLHEKSRVMTPAYGSISRFERDGDGTWFVTELNASPGSSSRDAVRH